MSFISIRTARSRSSTKLDISQSIEKTDSFQSVISRIDLDSLTHADKTSSSDLVPVKKNSAKSAKTVQKYKSGLSFDDRSVSFSIL